jgi:hypothetical protein
VTPSRSNSLTGRTDFVRYLIGTTVIAAILLALFDPSPSRGLGFWGRVAFWLLHTGAGLAIFAQFSRLGVRLGLERYLGAWGSTTAAGVVGSLLFAPAALLFERWLQVPDELDGPAEALLSAYGWLGALAAEYVQLVLPATALWVAINVPWLLRLDFSTPADDEAPRMPGTSSSRPQLAEAPNVGLEQFLTRVPSALGRDIVALSSELQYLQVHTTSGKALILHSLREAVELLAELDGMQVHRSHWVAIRHVRSVERQGRSMRLQMSNGVEIPVSRTFQKTVRETFGNRSLYTGD